MIIDNKIRQLVTTVNSDEKMPVADLALAVIPSIISLLFLARWTEYGWYRVRLYISEPISDPIRFDSRTPTQSTKILSKPAIVTVMMNIQVIGINNWSGDSISNHWIKNCASGYSNTRDGAVIAARKGKSALMLMTSAKELMIINARSIHKWIFRRRSRCPQSRARIFVNDTSVRLYFSFSMGLKVANMILRRRDKINC